MFPAQRTLLLFPTGHQVRTTFRRSNLAFFPSSYHQVCTTLPLQTTLLFSPSSYHQVCTTLPSQTTLLFFPHHIIKCVPHFHRRQPCFFPSSYHQVCTALPSQTTLLFFPTTSSSVCDASNTNDLDFFSQQIIKCVRYFQHRRRTRLSLAALKKIPTRKYKKGNSRTLV